MTTITTSATDETSRQVRVTHSYIFGASARSYAPTDDHGPNSPRAVILGFLGLSTQHNGLHSFSSHSWKALDGQYTTRDSVRPTLGRSGGLYRPS
jgi:hypothetical protein